MNKSTLDIFEQKAYEEALECFQICDVFAEEYELTTDYVYMEFVDPSIADLETVTQALDVGSLMVYNGV